MRRILSLGAITPLLLAAQCEENKDEAVELVRSRNELPALGITVSTKDEIRTFIKGPRRIDKPILASAHDRFHLGSNTKAMTATLIAQLIEEKKLRWDTTLEEIFNGEGFLMHPDYRRVTVAMLSAHRSGVTPDLLGFQDGILLKLANDPKLTLEEIRAKATRSVLSVAPESVPSSNFVYSNMNYVILGAIIEAIEKRPWEDVLKAKIWDPLSMSSCGFGAPGNPLRIDEPWPHKPSPQGPIPLPPTSEADNPRALGPAGTVHCNMQDWNSFLRVHIEGFNDHDTKILGAEGFKMLHTPYPGQSYTYGAWERSERPWAHGPTLSHDGSNLFNTSVVWVAPKIETVLLAVTNVGGADEALDQAIQKFLPE